MSSAPAPDNAPLPRGHGAGGGTQSLCPVCLKRIHAQLVKWGKHVYMVKQCPEHGEFRTLIWRGDVIDYADWSRPKIPSQPLHCHTQVSDAQCPFDCGLCPEHRQHTCTALLEITQRCDLRCPVCFADAGKAVQADPDLKQIDYWFARVMEAGGKCNIQLSGGEPTQRDDLPEIIGLGLQHGFEFLQINTNGVRLAKNPDYARKLFDAGLKSVFLQFDGVSDATYRALRGADLWDLKQRALEHCGQAGLGVVLVPTLVPGVNVREIGDIVRFGVAAGCHVRGVHFQPISYFGRFPAPPADEDRITLPDVMAELEKQCDGMVLVKDFAPPGCEHSLCSFHGNYLRTPEGGLRALSGKSGNKCCGAPIVAAEGAAKSKDYTARQWAGPEPCSCNTPSKSLEGFLDQVKTWTFSLSAMAFQDVWNLDLNRLKGCCIHEVHPDGRLVPFCAYNLTSASGKSLYRPQD